MQRLIGYLKMVFPASTRLIEVQDNAVIFVDPRNR
jgi:hypothetical protein